MADSDPGVEEWKEHTNPFDKVRSVTQTVSEPRSTQWIADEAAVTETTARGHLERLVEMTVLKEFNDADTTTYAPDPIYQRFQVARELLDEHDQGGLLNLKEDLHAQIEMWQDEYELGSPEELRELATGTDITEQATEIRRTATEWEIIEYRLDVVKDVIDNYDTYSAYRPAA